jgi:hypothetical protein
MKTEASVRRILLHAAVAATLAAIAAAPQPGIAQEAPARPNLHYGMNTRVITPEMADKMVELGAGVIRVPFGWDLIEPNCKGCFEWKTTDGWRDEAKRTGRTIFASLAYAPAWANGGHPYNYPPLSYQDWYDFVYATVSRYKNDITLWGVWNEPNLDVYLHGTSIDVYTNLAVTARSAIRAANPDAVVIGPSVSWHATTDGWFPAVMRATAALFDIVAVHWYADGPRLDAMMDDLVRPHSYGKEVWLAEVGIRHCASLFGEIGQALFYRQVLEAFEARRHWWTGVLFYELHAAPDGRDCGSAITREDWSDRPAFGVLQSAIRARP